MTRNVSKDTMQNQLLYESLGISFSPKLHRIGRSAYECQVATSDVTTDIKMSVVGAREYKSLRHGDLFRKALLLGIIASEQDPPSSDIDLVSSIAVSDKASFAIYQTALDHRLVERSLMIPALATVVGKSAVLLYTSTTHYEGEAGRPVLL